MRELSSQMLQNIAVSTPSATTQYRIAAFALDGPGVLALQIDSRMWTGSITLRLWKRRGLFQSRFTVDVLPARRNYQFVQDLAVGVGAASQPSFPEIALAGGGAYLITVQSTVSQTFTIGGLINGVVTTNSQL